MNCQEVIRILDEEDPQQLDALVRGEVERHLSGCQSCATNWRLFARFAALPDLPLSPALISHGRRAFLQGASPSHRRVSAGYVSAFVVAIAAAAAAAWLGLRGSPITYSEALMPTSADQSSPTPPAAPFGDLSAAGVAENSATMREDERANPIARDHSFTVRVLPLENQATEEFGRSAANHFYGAVLNELQKVPGLSLRTSTAAESQRPVDFELTFAAANRAGPGSVLSVTVKVRIAGFEPRVQPVSGDLYPNCVNGLDSEVGACHDAETLARSMIRLLAQNTFPMDPAVSRLLEMQLKDPSIDTGQRLEALRELKTGARRSSYARGSSDPDKPLSEGVVQGAMALARVGTPDERASVWREMRSSKNSSLVGPLLEAARLDPDSNVRRAALTTLAADFPPDARSAEILESISREDSSPLNRALAARMVVSERVWTDFIASSLVDEARGVDERMEALLHHVQGRLYDPRNTEAEVSRIVGIDGQEALGKILMQAIASDSIGRETVAYVVNFMGGMDHPAVTDALLAAADLRRSAFERFVIFRQLSLRASDQRVRSALQRIAASDPDLEVRGLAAQAIAQTL